MAWAGGDVEFSGSFLDERAVGNDPLTRESFSDQVVSPLGEGVLDVDEVFVLACDVHESVEGLLVLEEKGHVGRIQTS